MSDTGKTDIRHCEACGQVKFPIDHWQRKLAEHKERYCALEGEMLVLKDQLTCVCCFKRGRTRRLQMSVN